MKKAELYKKAIEYFETAIPIAETELDYSTPFDLLVYYQSKIVLN